MNKYLLLLLLPLLSFTLIGCDDEEDVIAPDLKLFAGTWEVVVQEDQNVFERADILHITSSHNIFSDSRRLWRVSGKYHDILPQV